VVSIIGMGIVGVTHMEWDSHIVGIITDGVVTTGTTLMGGINGMDGVMDIITTHGTKYVVINKIC